MLLQNNRSLLDVGVKVTGPGVKDRGHLVDGVRMAVTVRRNGK